MSSNIKLPRVRLSFPSLFTTESFAGKDTGKYGATFILDKEKHAAVIEAIKAETARLMQDMKVKLPASKVALKDGDESGKDYLEGFYTIKATTKRRPTVLDSDRTPLVESDNRLYAGCYVNAIITLWAQNNSYGKRINCSLEGVQFCADGEPLAGGAVTADDFSDFATDAAPASKPSTKGGGSLLNFEQDDNAF